MNENKSNFSSSQAYAPVVPKELQKDEIEFFELFLALWKGKWVILAITTIFAIAGVVYALSQPNIYKADVVLTSSQSDSSGGLAGMAAQFGGIASLAGINLNGGASDNKAMALAVLNSRKFINAFINKHDLVVPLMASDGWNSESGELAIDPEVYDVSTSKWVREIKQGQSLVPSDWETYKKFKKDVLRVKETEQAMVVLSVIHHSPIVAKEWADLLVHDLNQWMQEKSLNETRRNIAYLEQQLSKTNIADMRSVFFQLIEEQMKNLMLAEVENEFAFKVVDPAVIPEDKAGPKRAFICIIATVLGLILGMIIVFIHYLFIARR